MPRSTVFGSVIVLLSVFYIRVPLVSQNNIAEKSIELGEVKWHRSLENALKQSEKSGKPALVLFQEVPGCSTCTTFGSKVLSHPFVVELIETEFHPVVIYNNKGGYDRKILNRYEEPSWNNPVVRILNHKGEDIIQRHAGDYSVIGLSLAIKSALMQIGKNTPLYFDLFLEELSLNDKNRSENYYSMYCFWTGEGILGGIDGVVCTEAAFARGKEVVKVTYDGNRITSKEISDTVKDHDFQLMKNPKNYRRDKDPQYYLKKSDFAYLPLTLSQRTKINAAIYDKDNPIQYLSPQQKELLKSIMERKRNGDQSLEKIYHLPFVKAWKKSIIQL